MADTNPFLIGGIVTVGCLGICAAIAIPNFITMQYRAKRAEIPSNMMGIKTAELAFDAAFDIFVPTEVSPRVRGMLTPDPVPWVSTPGPALKEFPRMNAEFDTLGWAPDGHVRGIYWVEVADPATGVYDFTVHGMADIDGDGEPCHYTATKSINPVMLTPNDVF